jgi:hypothetical protein
MIMNTPFSVTQSTSCRNGSASVSHTAKIKSGGGTKLKLIVLAANSSRIRSNASGEMTDVPAAAERNSRSAV